jgi:hypothetical protein
MQISYEAFKEVKKEVNRRLQGKCHRYFKASTFLKFQRDNKGRIGIEPFYNYIIKKGNTIFIFQILSNSQSQKRSSG